MPTLIRPGLSRFGGEGDTARHPLFAYGVPTLLTDFITPWYQLSGSKVSAFSSLPSISIARASTGYAQTVAGTLTSFASGAARITDKGLLVEGAATNLATYSQDIGNAVWTATGVTKTSGVAAPDGTSTAYSLIEDTSTGGHQLGHGNNGVSNATVYTVSFYAKAAGRTRFRLYVSSMNNVVAFYQLSGAGTVDNVSGGTSVTTSISALGDGWYRCTLTDTTTSTTLGPLWNNVSTGTTVSYTGDGASGIVLWQYDLVVGAFASSPIVTTSASATRAADVISVPCVMAQPHTLYARVQRSADTGAASTIIQIDDGSANNRTALLVDASDLANALMVTASSTVASPTVAGAMAVNTTYKAAARFNTNSVQIARTATLGTEDTSCALPATPSTIRIGNNAAGALQFQGYIMELAAFPTAFTDANLQAVAP